MVWKKAVGRAARLVGRFRALSRGTAEPGRAEQGVDAGWVGRLHALRWEDGVLVVRGWALDRGVDYTLAPPQIIVGIEGTPLRAEVTAVPSPEPNLKSNGAERPWDYSHTVFEARFPAVELVSLPGARWPLVVVCEVGTGESYRAGRFTEISEGSSAGFPTGHELDGAWLSAAFTPGAGLTLTRHPAAPVVTGAEFAGDVLRLHVGRPVAEARGRGTGLAVRPRGSTVEIRVVDALGGSITMEGPNALRLGDDQEVLGEAFGLAVLVESGPQGRCRVVTAPALAVVDDVLVGGEESAPKLLVSGRAVGVREGARIALVGRRDTLTGAVEIDGSGRWSATVPLLVSTWGMAPLPPATGGYRVRMMTADGDPLRLTWTAAAARTLPLSAWSPWFRYSLEISAGRTPVLRLNRPLRDHELGIYHQSLLERRYAQGEFGQQDAVYLESFYERVATCNPRALDRELARSRPDLPRYWGVRDRSVAVPEGAVAVVDGTEEWWRARGSCRWVITNDWLRARFVHHDHQVVLQTWHGTMFKRIGLDLERTTGDLVPKFLHEQSLWDLLLSQNPHSTEVFKTAYAWDREFVEEGYPRNDLLGSGDGRAIRELLGISADKTVILYAPTWRDNTAEFVSYLDVDRLAADLGDDYVVLLRAHSRTIRGEAASVGSRVIDVTTYPDISDLFLGTDAIITDYSSIMFDFAVTSRPMIFFVPDLDAYRDELRGVYFELGPVAPGPVVMTQDGVLRSIRSMDADRPVYADRYDAWRQRFVPWDDGRSGERVLARLFATEPQPRSKSLASG